jgi:phage terminase large subunit-like protein
VAVAAPPETDPVTAYARSVVEGDEPAGGLVRHACERHLRDLEAGAGRGLVFDAEEAEGAIAFFGFLHHSKGEWAGTRFTLAPWQQFIVGSLFGWRRGDGLRRFRTAYLEVPRKNGKSTLVAGIGLLLAFFDREPGAEVYAAATKRDQAKICWGEARRMVLASPSLRQRITPLVANLHSLPTNSKFEPLGADSDSMDGLNIHGAIVDELHAHKTRAMVDVLETATGARRQPLTVFITTAGTDRQSVCRERHEYGERVNSGVVEDDTTFAYIATLDDGDDWLDERVWAKANPNLGVSVKLDDLRRKAVRARQLPTEQNAFQRLHLNVWTQQTNRWIPLHLWDAQGGAPVDEEALAGRECYGGLDLSATRDLTAWVLVFPREDDPAGMAVDILCRFWCPESWAYSTENRYAAQYQAWARAGHLTISAGEAVDYEQVRAKVLQDASVFRVLELNVDRLFQSHETAAKLQEEGLSVFGMGQGYFSMAAPMKEFERRLVARRLHHGGHPLLRFMVDHFAVSQDPAGNLKPNKAESQSKIDGVVALVMALDRAMRHGGGPSVYEGRGLVVLG